MKDRRKLPRKLVKLCIVIRHPTLGQIVGHARNMSESGVFLDVYQPGVFECGQIVGANIIDCGGIDIDPLLSMEVVRVELSGIALKFVEVSEEIVQLKALSACCIESRRQLNELSPADGDT
ncbi:hypothetical protein [Amphritea sp. HPY]|uniref:hypothetical protein n=1 Tax=Amphritea sp. HPY TaxID=3421652 RepID=UPI003D7CF53E